MTYTRNGDIDDNSVRTFATNFYKCLIHKNLSVGESFNIAQDINDTAFPEETHKYLLLPIKEKHDQKLELPINGQIIHQSPKIPTSNLLFPEHVIIGRERLTYKCYQLIHEYSFEKCIVLYGDSKIGKTEVSA